MAQPLSDAALVAKCRAGDEEAWHELVARYGRYVFAITVQGFRLREQEAEDVFQDVFARVYERLDQLRDDAAVKPWIAQLTRRLCMDRVARREDVALEDEGREAAVTDGALSDIEDAYAVHELLRSLPDECSEILDRFFVRDESYRTIGEALSLPSGTVASRISRCLVKLRVAWEESVDAPSLVKR